MVGGKPGQTMAELLWETFGPGYKKVTEEIKGDVITIITEEHIGLNYAHKLFAVCRDNISNNDPSSMLGLPHCRFYH
jgi:hypothetical protein